MMKKISTKSYILFLLLNYSLLSFSQVNFQAATIINLNGDTIGGYINYQNWERNPLIIQFKNDLVGPVENYTPKDIRSFQVKGDYYFSDRVSVDKTPQALIDLPYSAKPFIDVDTVFLSILVMGEVNLYGLTDRDFKQHYYIEKGESGVHELIYVRYLKEVQGEVLIQKNERYKGQLTYFLDDCPASKKEINKLKYRREDIMDLLVDYNQCVNPNKESFEVKEKGKIKIDVGFLAGISLTSMKFTSENAYFNYLTTNDFNNSLGPVFGVSLNLIMPRNREKWALFNDLTYRSYNFTNAYQSFTHENLYIDYTITLKGFYLKMSNIMRYQIPDKKVRLFFHLGVSHGLLFELENELKGEKYFHDTYEVKYGSAIESTKTYEIGLVAGIGGEFHKFSIELRYELGDGLSYLYYLGSRSNTLFFLLGYHL